MLELVLEPVMHRQGICRKLGRAQRQKPGWAEKKR